MEDLFHVLRHKHVVSIFILLTFMTIVGTVMFSLLEGWTPIQSLYFTVATMTTVGYGDLSPTTDVSRFITTVYMITIVPIMLVSVGVVSDAVYNQRDRKNNKHA